MSPLTMDSTFDSLPGLEVPVGKVIQTLADLWENDALAAAPGRSAFRASQMNVVLHFGLATAPGDAEARFQDALRFAKRYPCRILVLCPADASGDVRLKAKIFAECHIGANQRELSCCEAILLSYAKDGRGALENQVSTLIESDLPTYYWPHRFNQGRKIQDYLFFVNAARRVIVDTAIDGDDLLRLPWPRQDAVRDLVFARLLPVRQVLGQFLAGFPTAAIVEGLQRVGVARCSSRQPEARVLLRWLNERLAACASHAGLQMPAITTEETETPGDDCDQLRLSFAYTSGKHFTWSADFRAGRAEGSANLGGGAVSLTSAVNLLSPEAALGEAIFF